MKKYFMIKSVITHSKQVPATLNKDAWENKTIEKLEKELSQCRNDLKSDEEIFAEKAKEVNYLQEKIHKAVSFFICFYCN